MTRRPIHQKITMFHAHRLTESRPIFPATCPAIVFDMNTAWPGIFVGNAVLKDNIRKLRNCRITGRRRLLPMLKVQNIEQSTV